MPITIEYKEPIFWITMTGAIVGTDLMDASALMAKMEEEMPVKPSRITDLTGVTDLFLGFEDILSFAEQRRALNFPNAFKSAVVTGNDVQLGYARMFQTLNTNPQIKVQIFSNLESALEWLKS